jgi:hypothetical protein
MGEGEGWNLERISTLTTNTELQTCFFVVPHCSVVADMVERATAVLSPTQPKPEPDAAPARATPLTNVEIPSLDKTADVSRLPKVRAACRFRLVHCHLCVRSWLKWGARRLRAGVGNSNSTVCHALPLWAVVDGEVRATELEVLTSLVSVCRGFTKPDLATQALAACRRLSRTDSSASSVALLPLLRCTPRCLLLARVTFAHSFANL